ncbi:MAG TPA: carboxypeptidase-like regulatory domain-containing protein, partial [Thermoanaerobaculia bacterium]
MHLLLMLLMLAAPQESSGGTIDATIRGTTEPLEVELLLRDESDAWHEVEHKRLAANERRVRFDGLEPGVYQILLRGPIATQQLGTKIAVGTNDVRRTTIAVERFTLTGQITFGDTQFANGGVLLKHRELGWRAGISLDANGKFAAPMWQRGTYLAEVRGPALPTAYIETIALHAGTLRIAIPDGRITGIVRDSQSGAPIGGATVALQTNVEQGETHARLVTGPDGRFDFGGIQSGRQTIRIFPTHGLEPEPIVFPLDDNARRRELDVKVDAGRSIAIVVIDKENDPVANAQV